jgi:hypothetical protein
MEKFCPAISLSLPCVRIELVKQTVAAIIHAGIDRTPLTGRWGLAPKRCTIVEV